MRNTAQVFWNTLRKLTWKKILKLVKLAAPHPLLACLSAVATFRAYNIAKKYFPKTNSTDGVGNAFRHALWSCLIMMYCCKLTSPSKAAKWCRNMTDLHEELFPNEPLQKAMDLHNNKVGLDYFFELLPGVHRQFFETSFFIEGLLEKTKTAVVLTSVNENLTDQLVYLEKK